MDFSRGDLTVFWYFMVKFAVALYMGAWIEICLRMPSDVLLKVALYMGAWIEITESKVKAKSLVLVALYMGAWIEMSFSVRTSPYFAVALYTGAWIEKS